MHDMSESENKDLDNRLADFVDRLMCDDSTLSVEASERELAELQKTVLLIKKAFDNSKPSNEVVIKTKMNLLNSWQDSRRQSVSDEKKTFWEQLRDWVSEGSYQRKRGFSFNFAVLLILALAVGLMFSSPAVSGLTAAAGFQDNSTMIVIGMGVILGAILLWLMREK